jgi:FkbM family methyltransferase
LTDYSQDGEQEHILTACHQEYGKFLDLGAWNAFEKSNTRALYDKGWDGVMVEPSPVPFANLVQEYGPVPRRVTLINKAAGLAPGFLHFWITDDAVSTSDPAIYKKWKLAAKYIGEMDVEVVTLEQLYDDYGPFQFVNLDTEGTSFYLFRRLMEMGQRPRCICLEYDDLLREARALAEASGYNIVQQNGTNIVLVHGR